LREGGFDGAGQAGEPVAAQDENVVYTACFEIRDCNENCVSG
jgi:hypothetical protein